MAPTACMALNVSIHITNFVRSTLLHVTHVKSDTLFVLIFCMKSGITIMHPLCCVESDITAINDHCCHFSQQCDLQFIDEHKGFEDNQSKEFVAMLTEMLQISWGVSHKCPSSSDQLLKCTLCEISALWFQLALKVS